MEYYQTMFHQKVDTSIDIKNINFTFIDIENQMSYEQ